MIRVAILAAGMLVAALAPALAQPGPVPFVSGAVTVGHCAKWTALGGAVQLWNFTGP